MFSEVTQYICCTFSPEWAEKIVFILGRRVKKAVTGQLVQLIRRL